MENAESFEESTAPESAPESVQDPVPPPAAEPDLSRRRALLVHARYAAPLVGLLVLLLAAPLIRGTGTLYLRDVLNTHFPMKEALAEGLRAGYFPILDPYRAGGQPLAGNPNAVPFYPDNLLYLVSSTFWALNAHFWIHLLLAPFAFAWMARAWGLRRESAWAAAACWTLSGFYLSHLSFYNLIAAVTLAPALIAACLRFGQGARARMAPVIAVLWGLMLLGGDPLMALLGGLLAAAAMLPYLRNVVRRREPWGSFVLLVACVLTGVLLALPQLEEFRRILPMSFRGHRGYSGEAATVASWDPRQAIEWLVPFFFGRPDVIGRGSFWGTRYFTGVPPYYLSLYPGLLALALAVVSWRPRLRAAQWAWGAILAGLFLSMGRFNPIADWLFSLPGRGSLRYPVKFWLPVAVGAALLCGVGFDRLFYGDEDTRSRARRRFGLLLLGLALALGGFWAFLSFNPRPAEAWIAGLGVRGEAFVANERLRWAGLGFLSLGILAGLAVFAWVGRKRPALGGALLLAFHGVVQILLLRPLYPIDSVVPYLQPPPVLKDVPAGVPVVHADFNYLFGPSTLKQGDFPQPAGVHWMERRAFFELYPFTGPMWNRRFELNSSAEGLDTFLSRMAEGAVKGSKDDDAKRLRLLAAWGVRRLLMNHPLDPPQPRARLISEIPSFGQILYVYEIVEPAPLAFLPRRIVRAPHLNAAYQTLSDPAFDARFDAVAPGEGAPERRRGGVVTRLKDGPESMDFEVTAGPGGGLLVVQRSLHLWEAEIDGEPAEIVPANLYRIGVEIPEGRHKVTFRVDRSALILSFWGAAFGLALLPVLALWGGAVRRKTEEARRLS